MRTLPALITVALAMLGVIGLSVTWFSPLSLTVVRAEVPACIETDGGNRSEKAGFARTGSGENEITKPDSCNGDVLTEYYCDSASILEETYTCASGCYDGACRIGTALVPSAASIARKQARAIRQATRTSTRRSRTAVSQGERYKFPKQHSGVRRRLAIIRKPAPAPTGVRLEREAKEESFAITPKRCAGYTVARRERIAACNP